MQLLVSRQAWLDTVFDLRMWVLEEVFQLHVTQRSSVHRDLQAATAYVEQIGQIDLLEGSASSAKPISAGVPQGSIIGLVLVVMFIDDLASHLENDIHLFSDDSALHIAIKNTCDSIICAESLQCELNKIA